jgi:hypothetical protein
MSVINKCASVVQSVSQEQISSVATTTSSKLTSESVLSIIMDATRIKTKAMYGFQLQHPWSHTMIGRQVAKDEIPILVRNEFD